MTFLDRSRSNFPAQKQYKSGIYYLFRLPSPWTIAAGHSRLKVVPSDGTLLSAGRTCLFCEKIQLKLKVL
jgi:hypothetical protein